MKQSNAVHETVQSLYKQFKTVPSDELYNLLKMHYELPQERIISMSLHMSVVGTVTIDYEYLKDDLTTGYCMGYYLRKKELL